MLINSYSFLLFFIVVFLIYYSPFVRQKAQRQNLWILCSSYFFYAYADIRTIPLLIGSTIVFYLLGAWVKRLVEREEWGLASGVTTFSTCLGVGILLYFKYLGFFVDSFADLLRSMGFQVSWGTLHILLPVGVSFFTFKLISYVVEIHRERLEPSKDLIEFAAYVAFFPTIMSGPIDRPNNFLQQLRRSHDFNYPMAVDGCRQILWGMFTKMCIADNVGTVVDSVWEDYTSQSATALVVVAMLYTIQMYADFSGYSNLAIGVGKLMGFRVTKNFDHPFIGRNMAEFWRRWHMSLTSWITDYVYLPLNFAFRRIGNWGAILAIIINMIIIGLWHGARWTYGVFGLYHGLLFIPLVLMGISNKTTKLIPGKYGFPKFIDFLGMVLTFCLFTLGITIFRAPTLADAWQYLAAIITLQNGIHLGPVGTMIFSNIWVYLFIVVLLILEWTTRQVEHPLQLPTNRFFSYRVVRWGLYFLIFVLIFLFTFTGESQDFLYFQF